MSASTGTTIATLSDSQSQLKSGRRLDSVDLLRGLVMVIMALDHTREFFSYVRSAPEVLPRTNLAYFFARWITHFCAPTFFFLAGTGAFLYAARGRKNSEVASFLVKRGLWLVLLEFTLVDFGFSFVPGFVIAGVFYAIGLCLILLAAVIWLPEEWIAALGLGIIFLHNLTDRIRPDSLGAFKIPWELLHVPGAIIIKPPSLFFLNLYVILPWFGVMAAGYAFGALLLKNPEQRRRLIFAIGTTATALFFVLRFTTAYGQPPVEGALIPFAAGPYVPQPTLAKSIIAFFNVNKYPPSLQFVLMTLGPALMMLAWFDCIDLSAGRNWLWRRVVVYGRVPMFYYILHIWLIHSLAILVAVANRQSYGWLFHGAGFAGPNPGDVYGYGLPFVYLMWAIVVILLYPVCAWFADYKRTHKQWWLRYL
jgi:uncharacterized membrane protein